VDELMWLGALRHGESLGNVAADLAEAAGADVVDIDLPDVAVPLSERGRDQAGVLGLHLGSWPVRDQPTAVVSSPYRRAVETAEIVATGLTLVEPVRQDERIRDRELGVIDRLTSAGVARRMPDEAARRRYLGKFYYRPPGGESWADVALRLRGALDDMRRRYPDGRVLLVCHEAVIFLLRYLIEDLTVDELLSGSGRLANTGLSSWVRVDGTLRPERFDDDEAVRYLSEPDRGHG
jgi:2,3-bisphosphoglycerate-dependent phosphoglycerate mutase